MKKILTLGLLGALTAGMLIPVAQADPYYRHGWEHNRFHREGGRGYEFRREGMFRYHQPYRYERYERHEWREHHPWHNY